MQRPTIDGLYEVPTTLSITVLSSVNMPTSAEWRTRLAVRQRAFDLKKQTFVPYGTGPLDAPCKTVGRKVRIK